MRRLVSLLSLAVLVGSAKAATTINFTNNNAYGANIGWVIGPATPIVARSLANTSARAISTLQTRDGSTWAAATRRTAFIIRIIQQTTAA